jgi:hypothetical protein
MPRLRLKAELDGDAVFARLVEQVVKLAERLDGKRAGRFQKHLEDAGSVTPDERISVPILHAISFIWFVRSEGPDDASCCRFGFGAVVLRQIA